MEWALFIVGSLVVVVVALWRSRARMSWMEGPLGPNTADRMPDKWESPDRGIGSNRDRKG